MYQTILNDVLIDLVLECGLSLVLTSQWTVALFIAKTLQGTRYIAIEFAERFLLTVNLFLAANIFFITLVRNLRTP